MTFELVVEVAREEVTDLKTHIQKVGLLKVKKGCVVK